MMQLWLKLYFYIVLTIIVSLTYFLQAIPMIFDFSWIGIMVIGGISLFLYISFVTYTFEKIKNFNYEILKVMGESNYGIK